MKQLPRLAIMGSGSGTNLEALQAAELRGDLHGHIAGVVSDKPYSRFVRVARKSNLYVGATRLKGASREKVLLKCLRDIQPDLVVLAGYDSILEPSVVEAYRGRIVNTHSAPLPRFGGKGMYRLAKHQAVLDAGLRESEVTIHLVEEEVDTGRVLGVAPVPIMPGDTAETLENRAKLVEYDFYWQVINRYLDELELTS